MVEIFGLMSRITQELPAFLPSEVIYEFPQEYELHPLRFSLNNKQREAIHIRDHNSCQFPIQHECNSNKRTNQVHHIKNEMAAHYANLPNEWIDAPENVITLCEHVHKEIIHPDTHLTFLQYRSGNKNAFKDMQERRRGVMEDGRDYHFNVYDDDMRARAERLTRDAKSKGWQWPEPSHHR